MWYVENRYKYAICINLTTTCWDYRNFSQADAVDRQEIIEFPAVLINLQSRVIEADFHTYVRPIEHPKLDHFCEDYTGITQNNVNDGMLLSDALRKFHEWIRKLRITKDVRLMDENNCKQNTVFVTWTDFDLGIYLPKECARKHIKLPTYFDKWIDIRDYYSQWTGIDRIISFSFALKMVGMQFMGHPHLGADESRNLARLTCKMIRAGVDLDINSERTNFEVIS